MENKTILITGAAGFIGSHLLKHFYEKYPNYNFIVLDKLTYAGDIENISELMPLYNPSVENDRVIFYEKDICDELSIIFNRHLPTHIIHCAAESHVDRSIENPLEFVKTNVLGTVNLLNEALKIWKDDISNHLFHHISTDEVYGSLGDTGKFTEKTPYDPRSPYSASKASSDHFVRAYNETYKMPTIISNCSNNYGTHQYPEKLIPVTINKILNNENIPVYGTGENIRDWLNVQDHAEAIDVIFHNGKVGETYNIGGDNELTNISLIKDICLIMDKKLNKMIGSSEKLITFVTDRKGHDMRYAIDATKLNNELGWKPRINFREGLEETINYYIEEHDNKQNN